MTVRAARAYFGHLLAAGRSEATVRSYGMDLLRWFRFLAAAGVARDRAGRAEARDFCWWLQVAGKPVRPRWRMRDRLGGRPPAVASVVAYSPAVRAHCETVLRSFYGFHLEAGTGPLVNPFPLDRSRGGGRAHAHHSPMEPFRKERTGLYRPVVVSRIPRSVPDEEFNEIFAALPSHRDRALVAFYVSTRIRSPPRGDQPGLDHRSQHRSNRAVPQPGERAGIRQIAGRRPRTRAGRRLRMAAHP